MPIEAAVLVGAVYLLHRWRRSRADYSGKPLTRVPVSWGALYGCALVGLLSHLALDYTNNYGIRPFFPFDPHWFAASIAFIFDPVVFLLLVFALVLPSVFGLVSAEVGAKEQLFRGRGLAIAALLCICGWFGVRAIAHQRAVEYGMQQTYDLEHQPVDMQVPAAKTGGAQQQTELVDTPAEFLQAKRVEASPNPLDPFRWALAIDFGPVYKLATVDARTGGIATSDVTYPKLPKDVAIRAAETSPLGRVYLDWASMPIVTEDAPEAGVNGRLTRRVEMRDPRFMGDISWLRLSQSTPLTAVVTVDDAGKVVRESLDGRRERAGRGPVSEAKLWWPRSESHAAPVAVKHEVKQAPKAAMSKMQPQHVAVLPKLDLPADSVAVAPAPKTVAVAKVAEAPPAPKPVVAPAPPVVAKAAPVAVAPVLTTPTHVEAKVVKTEPAKAAAEAAKPEAASPVVAPAPAATGKGPIERFKNWLHWLSNGD